MQMILPLFPVETTMINRLLGTLTKDGIVTYLLNGMPIFSHAINDYKGFRYITSKLIFQGLCKMVEVSDCFHVSYDSVKRYVKKPEEGGEEGFFARDNRQGSCYKLLPAVIERIQQYLDEGKNNCEIARLSGVTEGAIRYAINKGKLKKNPSRPR
jgi:hypothetical protein